MNGKNIWTNGCFDILHAGHIELFKFAKKLGSSLYVGIDSDDRIRLKKGNDRPINKEQDRLSMLMAIKYIDSVCIFSNDHELCEYLKLHNIDIMVIGEEYRNLNIVGSDYVKQIIFFPRLLSYSTTDIIQKAYRKSNDGI